MDGGDDHDDADQDLIFSEAVPGRLDFLIDSILNGRGLLWATFSPCSALL